MPFGHLGDFMLFLSDGDGGFVKLDESLDITTTIEGDDYSVFVPPMCIDEFSCDFTLSVNARRIFRRILWNWEAKGPIRKRVLKKLWGYGR